MSTPCEVVEHGSQCAAESGGYTCPEHLREYERALGDLPALLGELVTTRTRTDRIERGIQRRSVRDADVGPAMAGNEITGEAPPSPANLAATDLHHAARNTLVTLVRMVSDDEASQWPANTVTAMCLWLITRSKWAVTSEDGPLMVAEVLDVARRVHRMVDSPARPTFVGRCNEPIIVDYAGGMLRTERCAGEVYAKPEADHAECEECRSIHDLVKRRRQLLGEVRNANVPLEQFLDALPILMPIQAKTFRRETAAQWVRRKRVVPVGYDSSGVALFRGRELVGLVEGTLKPKDTAA